MSDKVVGVVGKKFIIHRKSRDKFAMYDKRKDEYIDDGLIDQQKILDILSQSDEESKEILKIL